MSKSTITSVSAYATAKIPQLAVGCMDDTTTVIYKKMVAN